MSTYTYFCLFVILIISCFCAIVLCEESVDCQTQTVELDGQFIDCCKDKPTFTSEKCLSEIAANETMSRECIVECMYKDFEFLDDNNNVNMNATEKFFNLKVNDENFRRMFIDAFEFCSQKLERTALRPLFAFSGALSNDDVDNCDAYAAELDICVWYHTVSYCPSDNTKDDPICQAKAQWVKKCVFKMTDN